MKYHYTFQYAIQNAGKEATRSIIHILKIIWKVGFFFLIRLNIHWPYDPMISLPFAQEKWKQNQHKGLYVNAYTHCYQ